MHLEYRKLCKGSQCSYGDFGKKIKCKQLTALSHLLPGVDCIGCLINFATQSINEAQKTKLCIILNNNHLQSIKNTDERN